MREAGPATSYTWQLSITIPWWLFVLPNPNGTFADFANSARSPRMPNDLELPADLAKTIGATRHP
jgi:hypothetical protein